MLRNAPLSAVLNEEVALEGLEGTTLDYLWNRLGTRLKIKLPLPEKFCHNVWSLILINSEYMFYQLPEPRKGFVFFERLEHVDPATGVLKEPKDFPGHRFKYSPITASGIRGSCEHYDTRQVIAREELAAMTYQQVEARWPNKFAIVASQKMRESFIIEPNFTAELTIIQYCMLEWIARSRFNGETSQGKYSLVELTKDSSILYYNRKFLTDCKLITRQALCQRTGETSIQGMVFHLPRYYCEMKPKGLLITEKVVNILKTRPNYMADYDEIKLMVLGRAEARKWFRGNEFTKYVRTDETVTYRTLYPEAERREYMLKNKKNEEKQVRIMRLIDPDADVYDLWYKDEQPEEDQKDGFLDSQKAYIDMPVLQQAYNVIASSGEQGISQSALATQLGLDRLNARALVKNLMRIKAIDGSSVDEGRQRTTKYFLPGMTQRTISLDKEMIQLMSSHHSVSVSGVQDQKPDVSALQHQEQKPQPQQQIPSASLPLNPMASTSGISNMSESSNFSISLDDDDNDEEDEHYKINLNLYASANTTVIDSIDVQLNICNEINGVKVPGGISAMMNSKHISAKVLKRCNMILELVKKFHVIEPREVLKQIARFERESGYKAEACQKSVQRLIAKLATDNYLKIANVRLAKDDKVSNVVYACDLTVDDSSPILKGKIEAAKARMMMSVIGQQTVKKVPNEVETVTAIVGTSYEGTLAKCLRMKLFHEFMFYLIYQFSPDAIPLPGEDLRSLDLSCVEEEIGPIYSVEGWKLFVPPLNVYESYGQGWALLTDITLRLPLSVFCQICTFGFYTKDLDYWLDHPIRQHMLVKQLPKAVRLQLFRQRKYIFNIFEMCQKLCHAGLIQFGPQRMKDRDQTFIYLNRHTALLDTRDSAVGYHEIEEKEYSMKSFTFANLDDVQNYWETLYKIAVNTPLNRRSVAFGKEIMVQQLHVKPEIIEACKPRTPEQAFVNDVFKLPPGDNRGAAGMDTAMFVHLKSNWSKIMNYAPAVKSQQAKLKRLKTLKKIATLHKPGASSTPSRGANPKKMSTLKEKKLCLKAKLSVKPFASTYKRYDRKPTIHVRRIEKRPSGKRMRNLYDEVDRRALKLMSKLRVDWSRNEDTVLLICRIAMKYLFNDTTKANTIINSILYRDILHWTIPASANKTARACQRRISYMVKHKSGVAANIKLCVEEARLNPVLEARFGKNFVNQLKNIYTTVDSFTMALKIHFIELVYMLRTTLTKLKMNEGVRPIEGQNDGRSRPVSQFIPDTIADFEQRYDIRQAQDTQEKLNFSVNPTTQEDIIVHKLATLIHGTVSNARAKTSFSVQLFNIYKNYSEKHLSMAMKMIRNYRLISLSKKLKSNISIQRSIVPSSSGDNPYHISITYLNQISTRIPLEMFTFVYNHYIQLLDRLDYDEPVTFEDGSQGLVLLLGELATTNAIELELESPTEFISMHPDLRNTDPELAQQGDLQNNEFPEFAQPAQVTTVGPAKEIKNEPRSVAKVRFESTSDVYFNYVMHPIEKLTKIPTEYLHFFCILDSLNGGALLRAIKIDETSNICSTPDCLLQSNDRNIIQKCVSVALKNKDIIERVKGIRPSRVCMTPLLVISEDNLAQYFTRTVKEYTKTQRDFQKRDLGRLPDGIKSPINMVDLAYDIVQFQKVQDFNWLDRYEITHIEDDNGLLMDPENEKAGTDDLTEKVHKLHNFYVVNYLKISLRLLYRHPSDLNYRLKLENRSIPAVFLPTSFGTRQNLLTKISNDTLWPNIDELRPLLEEATPLIHQNQRLWSVAHFIEGKAEQGATVQELGAHFRNNHAELAQDLQVLLNFKFILRTGIRHITYVHWQHVAPWLLRTTCILSADPNSDSVTTDGVRIKQEPGTSHPKRAEPDDSLRLSSDDEEDDVTIEEVNNEEMGPPPKTRRDEFNRRVAVIEERNRFKPKKTLSLSLTPWIKIDGAINRRLLYRWMTAVLLYCLSHPGVQLTFIYSRFNMMAPVHLYYLLEMLQDFGCLKMYSMEVRQKKSIFSTYRPVKVATATEFDHDEYTYVETTANALSTLTTLIGDYRKFQDDFLSPPKSNEQPEVEQSDG
ncbi:general transcription factor 3C polypeptide 1 [Aedes albopictus]|uniref:B-block binding subunit of TFIIIC domain-containing protein n=1 Tax=Aedes albopictus TaxID=7160 RepID=A0ABM1YHV1_AEDAL